jgi:choline monooxygenase
MSEYFINKDISLAKTLPGRFYQDKEVFKKIIKTAFKTSWQLVGHKSLLPENGCCYPFELLKDSISEPLILVREEEGINCLSNVCTHRGKILVENPGKFKFISCGYHGRCFNLNGSLRSMPEFKEVKDFPSANDHLSKLPVRELGIFLFTSLSPEIEFEKIFKPILERMSWFPFDKLQYSSENAATYHINAHWTLYCDNYLEGFHVPFVHPALDACLDYDNYDTILYDYCNLQLGVAEEGNICFEIPENAEDFGKKIYAYYWWVFPNLMINIYTWGISVNIVEPINMRETRVRFQTYFLEGKESEFSKELLHHTEMEDEQIVNSVQKGLSSQLYKEGRFSVKREKGVHHFQSLLVSTLNEK